MIRRYNFPSSTNGLILLDNYDGASDGIYFKVIYEHTYSNGYYEPLTLRAIPDFH